MKELTKKEAKGRIKEKREEWEEEGCDCKFSSKGKKEKGGGRRHQTDGEGGENVKKEVEEEEKKEQKNKNAVKEDKNR